MVVCNKAGMHRDCEFCEHGVEHASTEDCGKCTCYSLKENKNTDWTVECVND